MSGPVPHREDGPDAPPAPGPLAAARRRRAAAAACRRRLGGRDERHTGGVLGRRGILRVKYGILYIYIYIYIYI
jgi:hypothetical protein